MIEEHENENTDKYTPVKPNYYYFKGHEKLYQTYEEYLNYYSTNVTVKKINLCIYQVVNDGKYPFLQYLLYNQLHQLSFLSIYDTTIAYNNRLPHMCKQFVSNFIHLSNINASNQHEDNIDYKGFYIYNDEMFVFFDITEYKLILNDINVHNALMFVLPDEIVNLCELLNTKIAQVVTDFFVMNSEFNFLYNDKDVRYEVPTVAYVTAAENKTQFIYIFGVSSSTNRSIFGHYYYFTNSITSHL